MAHTDKQTAFRLGVLIFVYLAILTALEFYVAVAVPSVVVLSLIALVKAGLVILLHAYLSPVSGNQDRPKLL